MLSREWRVERGKREKRGRVIAGARWVSPMLLVMAGLTPRVASGFAEGVSDERVSLPDGPGSIGGVGENIAVGEQMGAMQYSVPIEVPEGFAGLTPDVGLGYSSSSGSGLLGIGWEMSTPTIERMTTKGLPSYNADDAFVVDGSEELVRVSQGSGSSSVSVYRTRFERGFVRYEWQGDATGKAGYWVARHPDGVVSYYGAGPDGKAIESAQTRGADGEVFRYHLVATVDQYGRELRYGYTKTAGGSVLLDTISYVFTGGSARFSVRFAYEAREDVQSDCKPGFEVRLAQRLTEVRVYSGAEAIRRYELGYEDYAAAGGFSRLATVRQYGRNNAEHPIRHSFGYSKALGGACSGSDCEKPFVVDMGNLPGTVKLGAGQSTLIDINGDALPDVLSTINGTHTFYLSKLSTQGRPTFATEGKVSSKGSSGLTLGAPAVQVLDVNGDGRTDIVNSKTREVLCNNGSGDWVESKYCVGAEASEVNLEAIDPVDDPGDSGIDPLHMRFFDYDNDKRIDWLVTPDGSSAYVLRNVGNGFVKAEAQRIGYVFDEGVSPLQLADMNGDNLQDPVIITDGQVRYRTNLGRGRWKEVKSLGVPEGFSAADYPAIELQDINGDGLADLVLVTSGAVRYALNRSGDRFESVVTLTESGIAGGELPKKDSQTTVTYADMNGNGSDDLVWVSSGGSVKFLELFPVRPNLLSRVENGIGMVQRVEYGTSIAEQARDEGAKVQWSTQLPIPMQVVKGTDTWVTLTANETTGVHEKVSYRYRDGFYDGVERRYRGYGYVEHEVEADESEEPGLVVSEYDVGDKDAYRSGLLLRQRTYGKSGGNLSLIRETSTEYGDCAVAELPEKLTVPVRHVCTKAEVVSHVEGDESNAVTTRTESEYDGYGNVIRSRNLGVVHLGLPSAKRACGACAGDGVYGQPCGETCQGDEMYTETTYVVPGKGTSGAWITGSPMRVVSYGAEGGPQKETLTFYDGAAFEGLESGQLTKGSVSRVIERSGDGKTDYIASTRVRRDGNGNVVETLDPMGSAESSSGHRRVYTYDAAGLHVIRAEMLLADGHGEPYTLERNVTYDGTWDKVSEGTNWVMMRGGAAKSPRTSTRYRYDDFGRVAAMIEPGDSDEAPTQQYAYELASPASRIAVTSRSKSGAAADMVEYRCLDGQGREYQRRQRISGDSYQVSGFTAFNKQGKPVRQYQAYLGGASCDTAEPSNGNVLVTSYHYEAAGRVVEVTEADGTKRRTKYAPLATYAYDANDVDASSPYYDTPTVERMDGLGRLVAIERELEAGKATVTRLEYDSLGHFSGYTDAAGARHEQKSDLLGRVVEVRDENSGTTLFEYDAAGNLLRRQDGRGEMSLSSYDGANRTLAQWSGSDEKGTRVQLSYDEAPADCDDCTNVAGKLVEVRYPLSKETVGGEGVDWVGYDARGELVYSARSLEGTKFETRLEYDNAGRLTRTTLPDGYAVAHSYDAASRLTAVPGVIESIDYEDRGLMTAMQYANGVTAERSYDDLGRLTTLTTVSSDDKVLFGLQYQRDAVGNILEQEDLTDEDNGRPSHQVAWGYDAWYRVVDAKIGRGSRVEKLSFKYDAIDNVLSRTSSLGEKSVAHVGDYKYGDKAGPNAVSNAGALALGYDKAGYNETRGDLKYKRDHMGRLTQVLRKDEVIGAFGYGAGSDRVVKAEGGSVTHYISGAFELRDGISVAYVRTGQDRVARVMNDSLAASVLSDLAPAKKNGSELEPKGDGKITIADAWYAQAAELKAVKFADDTKVSKVERLLSSSARRMLFEAQSDDITYLHQDALHSTVLATNGDGELEAEQAFYPSGALRAQNGFVDVHGFTGQEQDESTGLIHFQYRDLDPYSGRWASVDPAFQVVTPESMQRLGESTTGYAYVANDPANAYDPTGLVLFRFRAKSKLSPTRFDSARYQAERKHRKLLARLRTDEFISGGYRRDREPASPSILNARPATAADYEPARAAAPISVAASAEAAQLNQLRAVAAQSSHGWAALRQQGAQAKEVRTQARQKWDPALIKYMATHHAPPDPPHAAPEVLPL